MKAGFNKDHVAKVNGIACDLSYLNLFFSFFYFYYQSLLSTEGHHFLLLCWKDVVAPSNYPKITAHWRDLI